MSSLLDRGNEVLSPVLAHYTTLEVKSGKGCYLWDMTGQAYLDFATGIAVASTGHCHPDVVSAIQKQAATLIHACAGIVYYERHIALAEKLGEILGNPLTSVFFCQSGTEAIEASIKLAKYTSGKSGLIAFKGGFHGRTLGALSITSSKEKYKTGYEPLLPDVYFSPYPYCYRCPYQKKHPSCSLYCLNEFEKTILQNGQNIAAVIIEPVLGEGGYIPTPTGFLKKLKEICEVKKILLIFDEIQTGFGRTGTWFYFQKENVIPDIIALAKGIASGLPLGACVASKELMSKWTTSAHGSTFSGNPISCAASLATIQVLSKALPTIAALGKKALKYLKKELQNSPIVGDIRAEGLMIGIEFVKDKNLKTPYPEIIKPIIQKCLENHLIVISCGIHDNVIRLMPPLIISEEDLLKGLAIFKDVIHATH